MKLKIEIILFVVFSISCTSMSGNIGDLDSVQLPYFRNSANECYFLDEFMPVPDSLVAGKYGRLNLRYYTYKTATYKDLSNQYIVLSFYSQDDRCWSLFEERYLDS